MAEQKKAFTVAELVLVITLLGILAFVAVPRMQMDLLGRQAADTVARKVAMSLQLARRLAIAHSADSVDGFTLSMTGSSPYSGYEIVDNNTAEVVYSYSIDDSINCTGGANFGFGPLGNLLDGSASTLSVSSAGRSYTITVISATGAVKCVEN